jgi:hypothetical protein
MPGRMDAREVLGRSPNAAGAWMRRSGAGQEPKCRGRMDAQERPPRFAEEGNRVSGETPLALLIGAELRL